MTRPHLVDLCTCGHSHLAGGQCWCGCAVFTPDADAVAAEDDDWPLGEVTG